MRLVLAGFWISAGIVYLFLWPYLGPNPRGAGTVNDRLPIALFCLVMFSYNMVRWRFERVWQAPQRSADELPPRPRQADEALHPEFDFSDPKPAEDKDRKPQAPG